MIAKLFFLIVFCLLSLSAHALPAPLSLEELCKKSSVILLGYYMEADIKKTKQCHFDVYFNVFPQHFYKKAFDFRLEGTLTFRQRYFLDTPECHMIPGPNATPDSIKAMVDQQEKQKYFFFFTTPEAPDIYNMTGTIMELTSPFYGIKEWDKNDKNFKNTFKKTRYCRGSEDGKEFQ